MISNLHTRNLELIDEQGREAPEVSTTLQCTVQIMTTESAGERKLL